MDEPVDTTSTVLPNLLIAGVQKGGTTWLHAILGSHEDVFMSRVKELRYFDAFARVRSETAWREYLAHFADAGSYRYRGESTPGYCWVKDGDSPFSPARPRHDTATEIRARLGHDAHVVVLLRNPVDRAQSAAHHHFALGRLGVETPIWGAPTRLGIVDMGFYKRHLSAFRRVFDPTRLHIMIYEDLMANPRSFLIDLSRRLDISCRSDWLDGLALYERLNSREFVSGRYRGDGLTYRGFSGTDRNRLAHLYSDDVAYVRALLRRNVWQEAR